MRPPSDPSRFYRLNEELALELARLAREGHLARLQGLLAAGGVELCVTAVDRRQGLEELLGVLDAAPAAGDAPRPTGLAPAAPPPDEPGCGCGGEERAPAPRTGGWDHESYLAARSRFAVVYPDGEAREVYMPDHVCPLCLNEQGNAIDGCARACAACEFRW